MFTNEEWCLLLDLLLDDLADFRRDDLIRIACSLVEIMGVTALLADLVLIDTLSVSAVYLIFNQFQSFFPIIRKPVVIGDKRHFHCDSLCDNHMVRWVVVIKSHITISVHYIRR